MANNQRVQVAGISVVFAANQQALGAVLQKTVERTAELLSKRWNLDTPQRCELRVLTDGVEFVRLTAPPWLRWLITLSTPLWRRRVEQAFDLAGGWTLPWPGRPAVGVKPPELLPPPGSNLGDALFVPVPDPLEKVKQIACHELTHAFTAHLRLPPWLNEGLAVRAVDHMVGEPTVLPETRTLAETDPSALASASYRNPGPENHQALIKLYASGYWLTRDVEELCPSVLLDLLARRHSVEEVNNRVEAALRQAKDG